MAVFKNFIGGSYKTRPSNADSEQSINWYPEALAPVSGQTKTAYTLRSKPGFKLFTVLAPVPPPAVSAPYILQVIAEPG